jgi:hypothetical protein
MKISKQYIIVIVMFILISSLSTSVITPIKTTPQYTLNSNNNYLNPINNITNIIYVNTTTYITSWNNFTTNLTNYVNLTNTIYVTNNITNNLTTEVYNNITYNYTINISNNYYSGWLTTINNITNIFENNFTNYIYSNFTNNIYHTFNISINVSNNNSIISEVVINNYVSNYSDSWINNSFYNMSFINNNFNNKSTDLYLDSIINNQQLNTTSNVIFNSVNITTYVIFPLNKPTFLVTGMGFYNNTLKRLCLYNGSMWLTDNRTRCG